MKKLTNNSTKILIRVLAIVFAFIMVAVACLGIYFGTRKKKQSPVKVNPIDFAIEVWDGVSSSETEFKSGETFANRGAKTYTIDSVEAFIYFTKLVNTEALAKNYNYFKDYTIYLNNGVDLNGYSIDAIGVKIVDENGKATSTFQGTFDGGYYTIYNGTIKGNGLFGYVENATIKNIGLYDVKITGEGEYVGGIAGTAINTNISDTYVRLGKITGPVNVGGLVGSFVSNNGTHIIENSFVDTTLKGENVYSLCANVNTNSALSNKVSILNSYYTSNNVALLADIAGFVDNQAIMATSINDFDSFDYGTYGTGKTWCDYSYIENSRELSFNYPILSKFNKVFMNGSFYEGVSYNKTTGESLSTSTLSTAFEQVKANQEGEVSVIVEKVFVENTAVATSGANIEFKSLVDTEIIRAQNNASSFIVGAPNSVLQIGEEEGKAITFDGNREYVEANNLSSDAAIISTSEYFVLKDNVTIKNNVNNTSGYGGGLALISTEASFNENVPVAYLKDKVVVENCASTKHGGGVYINGAFGFEDELINIDVSGCKILTPGNNGGGLYMCLSEESQQETPYQELVKKYVKTSTSNTGFTTTFGNNNIVMPLAPGYAPILSESITYSGAMEDCTNNGGCGGGAAFSIGSYTLTFNGAMFNRNSACSGAGAFIYSYGGSGKLEIVSLSCEGNNANTDYNDQSYANYFNGMGGALYINCDTNITGSLDILQCSANSDGGAIYFNGRSGSKCAGQPKYELTCTDTGSTYITNCGANYGSGVYFYGAAFNLTNFSISNCGYGKNITGDTVWTSGASGGAIFINGKNIYGDQVIGDNCNFSYNATGTGGGAIAIDDVQWYGSTSYTQWETPNVQITGADIKINHNVSNVGGGIHLLAGTLSVVGIGGNHISVSGNNGNWGGAIKVDPDATLSLIKFADINSNYGSGAGGGIFYETTNSATIEHSIFNGNYNTGTAGGGAIYSNAPLTLDTVYFWYNYAHDGGAIRSVSSLSVTGGEFSGNGQNSAATYTTNNGGAIYAQNKVTLSGTSFTSNTAYYSGGAINAEGAVDATNCTFTTNKALNGEGAAILSTADVSVSGGEFSSNTASINGGAISASGSITISDDTKFTSNTATNNAGGALCAKGYSIDGASFTGNTAGSHGGAIYNGSDGHAEIKNTTFDNNKVTTYGGGAISSDGSVIISENCQFSNNSVKMYGGAINVNNTLSVSDSTFTSNSAEDSGGAIHVYSGYTATISNCTFKSNSSGVNAGCIDADSTLTITGGTFEGNSTTGWAGCIDAAGVTTITGATFTGNHTTSYGGGALSLNNNSTLSGCTFTSNYTPSTSTRGGGAVWIDGGYTIEIKDNCQFNSNYTDATYASDGSGNPHGGAICCYNGTLKISDATFTGNESKKDSSGAISVLSGSATISGCTFTSNTALGAGGALSLTTSVTCEEISGCTFTSNTAGGSGGAVEVRTASTTFTNCDFLSNTSTSGWGGAIVTNETSIITNNCTFNGNSSKYSGGAIHQNIPSGNLIVNGGTFNNNKVTNDSGGAIQTNADTVTISSGTTFTNNSATAFGGALVISASTTITLDLTGVTMGGNVSGDAGGAVFLYDASEDLSAAHVLNVNTGYYYGNEAIRAGAFSTNTGHFTLNIGTHADSTNENLIIGGYYDENNELVVSGNKATGTTSTTGLGGVYSHATHSSSKETVTITKGTIVGNSSGYYGGGFYIKGSTSYSYIYVQGGLFKQNSARFGGAIYATYTTNYVYSGEFIGNTATSGNGGAIYNCADNIHGYIYSGTFKNNTATSHGGAIYHSNNCILGGSSSYTDGLLFEGNTAGTSGGAVSANQFTLGYSGCSADAVVFRDNSASYGGALHATVGTIYNATFDSNKSSSTSIGGSAIYYNGGMYNSTRTIHNITLINNEAATGGALHFIGNSTNNFTNITASGNKGANGAVISTEAYTYNSKNYCPTVNITGTATFENNEAINDGGAVYVSSGGTLNITNATGNTTFSGNTAEGDGGAIYCEGVFTISESSTYITRFTDNSAGYYGGAIAVKSTSALANSTFSDNSASDGGAIYTSGTTTLDGGRVSFNTSIFGAGVYVAGGTFTSLDSSINYNTASEKGGGIYVYAGSAVLNGSTAIHDNSAVNGAGVYVDAVSASSYGSLYVNDTTAIYGNIASSLGGGIYRATTTTDNNLSAVVSLFGNESSVVDEAKIIGMFTNYQATGIDTSSVDGSILNYALTEETYAHESLNCTVYHTRSGNAYGFGTLEFIYRSAADVVDRVERYDALTLVDINIADITPVKEGFLSGQYNSNVLEMWQVEDKELYAINSNRYPISTSGTVSTLEEVINSNEKFVYSYVWFDGTLAANSTENYTTYNQNSSLITIYNLYSASEYKESAYLNALYRKEWNFYITETTTPSEQYIINYSYSAEAEQDLLITNPTKDGYKFVGWSTGLDTEVEFEAGVDSTTVSSTLAEPKFYAVWSLDIEEVSEETEIDYTTIYFHVTEDNLKTYSIPNETTITTTITYTRYYCVYVGDNAQVFSDSEHIKNVDKDGPVYGEITINYSDTLEFAVRDNCQFIGWAEVETGTSPQWSGTPESITFNGEDGDKHYYAVWSIKYKAGEDYSEQFTHTFNIDDGVTDIKYTTTSYTYTEGIKYCNYNLNVKEVIVPSEEVESIETLILPDAQKDGFNFVGWVENEPSTTATHFANEELSRKENTVWYAVWQKMWCIYNTSTLEYDTVNYVFDAVAEQSYILTNSPSLTNCEFVGYTTDAEVTINPAYTTTLTSSLAKPTFFAVWKTENTTHTYEEGSDQLDNTTLVSIYFTPCIIDGTGIQAREQITVTINGTAITVNKNALMFISADIISLNEVETQLFKIKVTLANGTSVYALITSEEQNQYEITSFAENGITENISVDLIYADAYRSELVLPDKGTIAGVSFDISSVKNGDAILGDKQNAVVQKGATDVIVTVDEAVLTNNSEDYLFLGFTIGDEFYTNTNSSGPIKKISEGVYKLYGDRSSVSVVVKERTTTDICNLPENETLYLYSTENYELTINKNQTNMIMYVGEWKISNAKFLTGVVADDIAALENIFYNREVVERNGEYYLVIT